MKKKMIAVLLACALTVGMTAGPAGLVTVRAEGEQVKTTENGLTYQEIGDGIGITDYTGTATEVVIPESIEGKKVTHIGDCAFNGCRGLTSVNIPEVIMSIGNWAFSDCSGLTSVNIPEGITSIGQYAFGGCSGLTSVNIPAGVTSIGHWAFSGCSSLRDIQVEETNADYKSEDGILYNKEKTSLLICPGGKTGSITIPDGVESIENRAFNGCSGLTSVDIPEGITSIEYSVFEDCSGLTSVNIPTGVTRIGSSAFSGCSGLTSVNIPAGVTSIENRAFSGCSGLTGVNIPSSVTYIGEGVFSNCSSLRDIQAEETNTAYKSENGILYNKEKTSLLICPGGKIGSMAIPAGVTSIGDSAFRGCSGLTSVNIPSSVTSIGEDAFSGCRSLTSVNIPSSVTYIGDDVFSGCSSLRDIQVEETNADYKSEDGILYNKEKTSLLICPGGKTGSIVIPAGVTRIRYWAFSGCSSLRDIQVEETNADYKSENGILYNKEKTSLLICPRGKTGSIAIPAGVTSIENRAFSGCSGLTSVNIPSSVTSIGEYAFSGCSSLTSVNIPSSVTSIDFGTFIGCNRLTSVSIPLEVTDIGDGTFIDCDSLKDVYYAGSPEQWKKIHFSMEGDAVGKYDYGTLKSAVIHYNSYRTEPDPKTAQTITAGDITKTYGEKAFSLGAKSSGDGTLSYAVSNPKVATVDGTGKVTIHGCGITDITITAAETNLYAKAQKVIKLTVKPKKMTLKSVKSKKRKTVTVKWKKDETASGYLIECATDKKFKKNKVQATIGKNKKVSENMKKLKAGKKYYVRICAYVKSGNANIQGDWSKVKTVKVKK